MFLILDTNILFSFFKKSKVFILTKQLRSKGYRLIAPDFVLYEIKGLKKKILKSTKISESEFDFLLLFIRRVIRFVSKVEYESYIQESKKISPHLKDFPLFALSLAFGKPPIWTRESRLKKQEFIRVFSDKEVEKLLEEI